MLIPRIITALVLAGLVASALVFLTPLQLVAVFAMVMLIGAWEWSGFIRSAGLVARLGFVILIGGLLAALYWLGTGDLGFPVLLWVSLAWWVLALLWLSLKPASVPVWSVILGGIAVFVPFWVALSALQLWTNRGPEWLFFLVILVASADVGAFFSGRFFGRTKLAPRVSPGKTWEGCFGGLGLSLVTAVAGALWFEVSMVPFLLLCVFVVALSIVGDLTESMFKRNAGLKDSGKILPGHGGILDRIDSLTAAAPLFVLGLFVLGRLAAG